MYVKIVGKHAYCILNITINIEDLSHLKPNFREFFERGSESKIIYVHSQFCEYVYRLKWEYTTEMFAIVNWISNDKGEIEIFS